MEVTDVPSTLAGVLVVVNAKKITVSAKSPATTKVVTRALMVL